MSELMTAPMTPAELTDLGRLEAVVESGLATFVAVGRALAEIHSRELYRATHGTWEAYCTARWKFSRRHADRLMGAASVVADLLAAPPKNGAGHACPVSLPSGVTVAMPLVPLSADARRAAWQAAQEATPGGAAPTAAEVGAAARGASAQQQLDRVQDAEDRAAAAAAPLERPDDRTRRLYRYIKNVTKAWRAASHMDDKGECDELTALADAALARARELLEASGS